MRLLTNHNHAACPRSGSCWLEIAETLKRGRRLLIELSPSDHARLPALLRSKGFDLLSNVLTADACDAQVGQEEDRAYLVPRIEALEGGFDALKPCVKGVVRAWLAEACTVALREAEAGSGARPPSIVNTLALLLKDQGEHAAAEALFRRMLAESEGAGGVADPQVLFSMGNFGGLLQEQGMLDEAESVYRQALAGLDATLGAWHHETLRCLLALASLLRERGTLDEAGPLAQRALEAKRMGDLRRGADGALRDALAGISANLRRRGSVPLQATRVEFGGGRSTGAFYLHRAAALVFYECLPRFDARELCDAWLDAMDSSTAGDLFAVLKEEHRDLSEMKLLKLVHSLFGGRHESNRRRSLCPREGDALQMHVPTRDGSRIRRRPRSVRRAGRPPV